MTTTTIEFFGGLEVIGSSKILVTHGDARVLLDIGLDIPAEKDLFRAPVGVGPASGSERADLALVDKLRRGVAPRVPGLWAEKWLSRDVRGDDLDFPGGDFAVFISHAHLDHMGLVGFVDPSIPVYASAETARLMAALEASGERVEGAAPSIRPIDGPIRVGEIEVECIPVDHDVPGASGFLVTTPDGRLAFTGDIRFHGEHPERSWAFAERVRGVDVLVSEGTTLSWDVPSDTPRTEDDVIADVDRLLAASNDLQLLAVYQRDVERMHRIVDSAQRADRRFIAPGHIAAFCARMRVPGVHAWAADRPERRSGREAVDAARADGFTIPEVSLADVQRDPGAYVVMPDALDFPSLGDLPIGPQTTLFHANGQPLGAFDASWWGPFQDWLEALGIRFQPGGCSGHATPDDLFRMLEIIKPRVVFPIHTFTPRRLIVPAGTKRVIAQYGLKYTMRGEALD